MMIKKRKRLAGIFIRNYIFVLLLMITAFVFIIEVYYLAIINSGNEYIITAQDLMKDQYEDIESQVLISKGGSLCIMDESYHILRSEGTPIFNENKITMEEFISFISNEQDSMRHITIQYNEKNHFFLIVSMPQQVKLIISLFLDNSSGSNAIIMLLVVVIAGITILACSIVMYSAITARSFRKPLSNLADTADRIKAGQYDAKEPDSRIKEIYDVQEAFYLMSGKISKEIENTKKSEENRKKLMLDISHDLKNPLMSMRGYAELLQADDLEIEKRKQYKSVILENCIRADQLVRDLFYLAKMENAENRMEMRKIDVAELLKTTLINRLDEMEILDLGMDFHIPDEEIFINADEDALIRAFSNILDNAITYGRKDDLFVIRLAKVNNKAVFSFSNGSVLAYDKEASLTQTFIRAKGSEILSPEGTGIGLSIVEKIIKLHGGSTSCGYENGNFNIGFFIPIYI